MKAQVTRKGLIINDVEQEVGAVIDVSKGFFERSTKVGPVEKKTKGKTKED